MFRSDWIFRAIVYNCIHVCMYVSTSIYICMYVYMYIYICMKRSKASTTAHGFWHVHSQLTVSDQCP